MKATPLRRTGIVTRPTTLSALALAASHLLGAGVAQAAPTEEELQAIKLYGNVSIAQDKLADWGPWAAFEAPAAGPQVDLRLPEITPELYRPLAQGQAPTTPTPSLGCAASSLCGFGAFSITDYESLMSEATIVLDMSAVAQDVEYVGNDVMSDIHPVLMVGTVTQPGTGNDSLPAIVPGAISISSSPITTGQPLLPESGELTLYLGKGLGYERKTETDTGNESYQIWTYGDAGGADPQETELVEVMGEVNLRTYLAGEGEERDFTGKRQDLVGVMGFTTSEPDMTALRGRNATATYIGNSINGNRLYYAAINPVRIDVKFGDGTWTGSWNGGKDGYVSVMRADSGTILQGQVGFLAEGTISGVNFNSTKITTLDADSTAISGTVKGAFFGPEAAAVGGVVDITKTRSIPEAVAGSVRAGAAVSESTPGYGTGRYVAPFIAVQEKYLNQK